MAFLRDNPAALRLVLMGRGRIPGVTVAQNGAGQICDDTTPQDPVVILRHDDLGRIYRIISDNAIGCAIMMEAARILIATGVKPRRKSRVALWSGEEECELGSFNYAEEHSCSVRLHRRGEHQAAVTIVRLRSPGFRTLVPSRTTSNTTPPRGTPISTRTSVSFLKMSLTMQLCLHRWCCISRIVMNCLHDLRQTKSRLCQPVAMGAALLTAAIGTRTTHGKVVFNSHGSFVFTPNRNFAVTDTFTYKVHRGSEASADATVTILVK